MAWRCGLSWQPIKFGRTMLPGPSRCLSARPRAWSSTDVPQEAAASAAPSTPVPALQNNIISRPRMFTTLHTTARPTQTSPAELRHAAKMARLSGFAYKGEDLADLLAKEGLSLVARGESHFTRWYVADVNEGAAPEITHAAASGATSFAQPGAMRSPRQRVVMMRGMVWRTGDFNTRLWADMMKFWPGPYLGDLTQPRDALYAHAGMADMAEALLQDLRPYLIEAKAVHQDVTFGGHSLGGAFALLMACAARLRLQLAPAHISCFTFGSPPVLARANKADARTTLQIVGLAEGCMHSFVLDNDPVPRAMLSVDPTFAMLKNAAPVSWLLEARRRLLGDGAALTPERFLYENAGEVYLIRWSPDSGQKVTPLAAAEVEEQLRMAVEEIVRTPATLLQALLDHSHGSYAQELWAAARQLERRAERQAGAAAPGLGAGASSFETLER